MGVRLGAVFTGFLFLIILELILRAAGLGKEFSQRDPFYGFQKPLPLFEKKETKDGITRYSSDTSWREGEFNVQDFLMPKPEGTLRIFCFGGSTVFGFPYWDPGSFPRLLEKGLAAVSPFQKYEVINAGAVGYASNRIRLLLNKGFAYDPDLIVLYTGNNEFLEQQFYLEVLDKPEWVLKLRARLYRVRLYSLIARPVLWVRDHFFAKPLEERGLLDESGIPGKKEKISWSLERKRKVEVLFAWNLKEIIKACREHGVPLLLINPAVNLRDYPPNLLAKSLPLEDSGPFKKKLKEGINYLLEDQPDRAMKDFLSVLKGNPDEPNGLFLLGQCWAALGEESQAYQAFLRACDEDRMPTRITTPLRKIIKESSRQKNVIYFSAQEIFEARSPQGIPGNNLFLDHCHPQFNGHYLIAGEIIRVLIEHNIIQPRPDWQSLFYRAGSRLRASFSDKYLSIVHYREAFFLHRHMKRSRRAKEMIEEALRLDPDYEDTLILKREIQEKIERDNPPPWY